MEKNVIYFDSNKKYHDFVVTQRKYEIGEGAEGIVYITKNNEVIKEIFNAREKYPNDDLLMESDIKLDSFLFPKELYVCRNEIIGYKTDFFRNIFRDFDGNINDIDLDAVVKAGYKMMKDVEILSKMNYILYDLPYNILFDGTSLKAIDTLQYYKRDDITLEKNISILRDALVTAIKLHDEYCSAKSQNQMIRKLTKSFE
jgi:hypothetical protein